MAYDSTNTGAEVDAAIAKVKARSGDLIDGSGNATKITKFSGANTITDSIITDSGSAVTVAGSVVANTFSVADGTASLPSITNTGDTNTGIYFPTENSIAFTAGAGATLTSTNTALTIGVPTTIEATAQADLTLQGGDANSKNLIFKKASAQQGKISVVNDELTFHTGTTERMRIKSDGKVGIGTNFSTSTIAADFHIRNTGDASIIIEADTLDSDEESNPNLVFKQDGGNISSSIGSLGSAGQIFTNSLVNATYLGSNGTTPLQFFTNSAARMTFDTSGNVGIGTATPDSKVTVRNDGTNVVLAKFQSDVGTIGLRDFQIKTPTADSQTEPFRFTTNNSFSFEIDDSEAVRINQTGKVGIGEATPTKVLHVKSSNSDTAETIAVFGNGDIADGLEIKTNGNGGSSLDWGFNAKNSRNLVFETNQTEHMRIDSSGNVGIGTASPSEELEVSATGVGLLVRNSDANQEAGIATVRGQRADANTSPAAAGGMSLESWNTSGATVVNEHLGSVYFGANHTSGSESNILGTASIAGIAEGTFSNSSTMPSGIAFRTGSVGQAIGVYNQHVGEVERMRIDSSGNVGIGDSTPSYKLDVNGTGRFAGVLSAGGDLEVSGTIKESVDNGNLVLQGGGNGGAHIELYGTSHATENIRNNAYHDAGVHVFRPVDGSVANFLITTAGDVAIGPAAPAHALDVTGTGRFSTGVTFGSDTAAANKLDDYEEGTWAPAITFGGGNTGVSYNYQVGTYTKIGDLVNASCYMSLSSKGSSTGAAVLTNLPFASRNLTANLVPAALRLSNISFADFPMGWNQTSSTDIHLQETTNAGVTTNLTDANFSNSSEVMISISYRV